MRKGNSVGREEYVTTSDISMPARTVAQISYFCAISLFCPFFRLYSRRMSRTWYLNKIYNGFVNIVTVQGVTRDEVWIAQWIY